MIIIILPPHEGYVGCISRSGLVGCQFEDHSGHTDGYPGAMGP